MTLDDAEEFVDHIHSVTGRWPGFYSGHTIKRVLGNRTDTILANCWFWLAQYQATPAVPAAWSAWTMWQYTDGAAGADPHMVEDIGSCDRDKFNENLAALQQLWGTGS